MFHRHRVNKLPLRTGSSYITAEAYCARLRCTAYYFIYESPSIRTSSYRLCHVRPMPHELENISNGGLLITIVNNTDFQGSSSSIQETCGIQLEIRGPGRVERHES
jgi:hypothetical protein